jgi:hypothetical protein
LTALANGSISNPYTSSYSIRVTSKYLSPVDYDVSVIFDFSSLDSWTPSIGDFGGEYKNANCPKNNYVQKITGSLTNWGPTQVFTGLKLTCTDGTILEAQSQSSGGSLITLADCSSASSYPVSGMYGVVGPLGTGIKGLRFVCANNSNTGWVGNQDPSNTLYYICPAGQLVSGTHVFGGGIMENFAIQCSKVPFSLDTTMFNAFMKTETLAFVIPTTPFSITLGYGNVGGILLKFTVNTVSASSAWLETLSSIGSWEKTESNTVYYGDIQKGNVRIRFAPNAILNESTISFNILCTTPLRHSVSAVLSFKAIIQEKTIDGKPYQYHQLLAVLIVN